MGARARQPYVKGGCPARRDAFSIGHGENVDGDGSARRERAVKDQNGGGENV